MGSEEELKELLERGLSQLKSGDVAGAVFSFEELLVKSDRSAMSLSCLGIAMARANLDLKAAEKYCKDAIRKSPGKGDYYRCLAEVYQIKGNRAAEIEMLNKGLKVDRTNKGIRKMLNSLGIRKEPVIPFLPRSNFLNKLFGKIRAR